MPATTTCAQSTPKTHVSDENFSNRRGQMLTLSCCDLGIKEVVTLTSDLSRKNLEKDFERMDTPQGTFYRVYFDIYLTLDGSEFSAELVCQGEVMGRCRARFR